MSDCSFVVLQLICALIALGSSTWLLFKWLLIEPHEPIRESVQKRTAMVSVAMIATFTLGVLHHDQKLYSHPCNASTAARP